mmetsp:Transcript_115902/g.368534  ORF Transcript_115902/g.368534 Transcript_115902/m.368534 type:complete len:245 (-) Transcript_115902:1313-2047(-)
MQHRKYICCNWPQHLIRRRQRPAFSCRCEGCSLCSWSTSRGVPRTRPPILLRVFFRLALPSGAPSSSGRARPAHADAGVEGSSSSSSSSSSSGRAARRPRRLTRRAAAATPRKESARTQASKAKAARAAVARSKSSAPESSALEAANTPYKPGLSGANAQGKPCGNARYVCTSCSHRGVSRLPCRRLPCKSRHGEAKVSSVSPPSGLKADGIGSQCASRLTRCTQQPTEGNNAQGTTRSIGPRR